MVGGGDADEGGETVVLGGGEGWVIGYVFVEAVDLGVGGDQDSEEGEEGKEDDGLEMHGV